jgi:hypothetical protein
MVPPPPMPPVSLFGNTLQTGYLLLPWQLQNYFIIFFSEILKFSGKYSVKENILNLQEYSICLK